jgi:hypothetical protein
MITNNNEYELTMGMATVVDNAPSTTRTTEIQNVTVFGGVNFMIISFSYPKSS